MATFIDQTGKSITLKKKPLRIISLVPSQSEFLWDLGLKEELIGITKFCIHPHEMFKTVQRIGGTKTLNLEKIKALKPDLVIGNKEENDRSQIEALQKEFNVWMSDIYNFKDAFEMMKAIGEMTGKKEASEKIIAQIKKQLPSIKDLFKKQKVIYFIWNKPYMIAGKNTFIDYVLNYTGLSNGAKKLRRYPGITNEKLMEIDPEFCFLSSEPFPFKAKHAAEIQKILPGSKIHIVDGEMFSWYGSRLTKLPAYVNDLKKTILK
jgi:ABC-type Fe3+-hydroxamate transport system substrate-binding protein